MAVMGMKRTRDLGEEETENSEVESVHQIFQDGHSLDVDMGAFFNLKTSNSLESNISHIGGPTPKRTKPRRSFKNTLAHHTKVYLEPTTETRTQNGHRCPMKDLGIIKQNMDVSIAQMQDTNTKEIEKESENAEFEMGDVGDSFNDSDIFNSTDQYQFRSEHHRVGTKIYEDTTTEF